MRWKIKERVKKEWGRKHRIGKELNGDVKGWRIVIEEQNGHERKSKGKMEDKGESEKRIGKEAWDRQGTEWM